MSDAIAFMLDGHAVEAHPGETIWQVAKRLGSHIPHLCHRDAHGYRPDGNCRSCMVEIAGERVLAPSCRRHPTPDMQVTTDSARAEKARALVMELLVADQPARETSHDPDSHFWTQVEASGLSDNRFPRRGAATCSRPQPPGHARQP